MCRWIVVPLLVGCSEYEFVPHDKPLPAVDSALPEVVVLDPKLIVDPIRIEETGICGSRTANLTLLNVGEGELVIDEIALAATGWSLHSIPTPLSLASGEMQSISLVGTDGAGLVSVYSNDPTDPLQWVELLAVADQPPDVTIASPFNGAVIPVSGDIVTGFVSDDVDAAESLAIEWYSDLDGVLSTSPADVTGETILEFADGSPGDHELQLVATDSCGNESQFSLRVCQQYGYEVESLDISTWQFEGVANWNSQHGWVELTPPVGNVVGSAFSTAIPVDGGNVQIEFLFYIGDGSGADGISLTALDIDRMTSFLGGTGCGIGYGGDASCTAGPALPGWSIEVDTYYNGGQDPTSDDHLAFTFDGDVDGPVFWSSLPEMEDTGWHSMLVQVSAPHVYVEIDGVPYMDANVSGYFGFPAYIGFTAGTGGATNAHLIDSLIVTETACVEE